MKIIIIIFLQVGRKSRHPRGVKPGLDSPGDLFGGKCIRIEEEHGKKPGKGSEKNESKKTCKKNNSIVGENLVGFGDVFTRNP